MLSPSIYDIAIETAMSSPSKKKVGAILLNKNKVVMTATNLETKSHPLQASFAFRAGLPEKIYLHAEISALVKCKEECDTIVVARVNNQGKLRIGRPCPICALALKEAGVHNIHYTTDEGFLYEYRLNKQ
ncbi:MAG: cytidine deaminase [Candidatus Nanopelagicales bacterium]